MPGRRGDPLVEWRQALLRNDEGNARANLANAMVVLRLAPEFQGRVGYDKLRSQAMAMRPLPWDPSITEPREWRDNDDTMLAEWLQVEGINVVSGIAAEAVQAVSYENSFHPVLAYLEGLSWDGEPRLDEWAISYLGVTDSEYVRAVSSKWMISAVARVFNPGCKADCALVLEGPQGIGKSTVLRNLSTPWFTDEIAAFGTKDASEQTIGIWIVELSELEAVTRAADVAHVKAFMSRQRDRFRVSYGRRVQEYPRQCVFAATSNSSTWNRDDTGGRRWWPLTCGVVRAAAILDVRDQLWAEARDRFFAGEAWHIDDPLVAKAAEQEQQNREVEDVWQQEVSDYLRGAKERYDDPEAKIGKSRWVSVGEVMLKVGIESAKLNDRKAQMDVVRCLKRAGWDRYRTRRLTDGTQPWRYRPLDKSPDA
jgi:predicted P-loop ATPase